MEFLKTSKAFLNKGAKHKKIMWKIQTQKIKILKVADPLKFPETREFRK